MDETPEIIPEEAHEIIPPTSTGVIVRGNGTRNPDNTASPLTRHYFRRENAGTTTAASPAQPLTIYVEPAEKEPEAPEIGRRNFLGVIANKLALTVGSAAVGAGGATAVDGYIDATAEHPARLQLINDILELRIVSAPQDNSDGAKDALNRHYRLVVSNILQQVKSDKFLTSLMLSAIQIPTNKITDINSNSFNSPVTKAIEKGVGVFIEEIVKIVPQSYDIIVANVAAFYPDPNPTKGEKGKNELLVSLQTIHTSAPKHSK